MLQVVASLPLLLHVVQASGLNSTTSTAGVPPDDVLWLIDVIGSAVTIFTHGVRSGSRLTDGALVVDQWPWSGDRSSRKSSMSWVDQRLVLDRCTQGCIYLTCIASSHSYMVTIGCLISE